MQQCQKANQLLLQLDYVKYNIEKKNLLDVKCEHYSNLTHSLYN